MKSYGYYWQPPGPWRPPPSEAERIQRLEAVAKWARRYADNSEDAEAYAQLRVALARLEGKRFA